METLNRSWNAFLGLFESLSNGFLEIVPTLLLIAISIIIAYLVEFFFRIILRMIGVDRWLESTSFIKVLHMFGISSKSHVLIGKWLFWITLLILLESIAHVREWTSISGKFQEFVTFIPLLIGAIIIIVIGTFISKFIRKTTEAILKRSGSNAASLLSTVAFYALMLITITIALNQVGLNTSIITANIAVILGALLFSFSLAFVFASKEVMTNLLSSSYNRNNFSVGQRIRIEGIEGEIIKITNISVILKTPAKIVVIPSKKLVEESVEILG